MVRRFWFLPVQKNVLVDIIFCRIKFLNLVKYEKFQEHFLFKAT